MKVAATRAESKRVDFSCRRRESAGRTQREMKDLPPRAAQPVNAHTLQSLRWRACPGFESQISDTESDIERDRKLSPSVAFCTATRSPRPRLEIRQVHAVFRGNPSRTLEIRRRRYSRACDIARRYRAGEEGAARTGR
jgi:hypothetical protein